jgi:cytochrome bd-type quinol oxidase subunit 2
MCGYVCIVADGSMLGWLVQGVPFSDSLNFMHILVWLALYFIDFCILFLFSLSMHTHKDLHTIHTDSPTHTLTITPFVHTRIICTYSTFTLTLHTPSHIQLSYMLLLLCLSYMQSTYSYKYLNPILLVTCRCYCECSEIIVLLVPTVAQYLTCNLTIPQQLPNIHKSK